jgi:hypothetical protein
VDYSRPIGAYVAQRAYSSRTFGSMDTAGSAEHGHSSLELVGGSLAHATPGHEPGEDEVMHRGYAM